MRAGCAGTGVGGARCRAIRPWLADGEPGDQRCGQDVRPERDLLSIVDFPADQKTAGAEASGGERGQRGGEYGGDAKDTGGGADDGGEFRVPGSHTLPEGQHQQQERRTEDEPAQ